MKTVTIESHFLKDIGIVLGRSMRHLSGSRDTFAVVAIMHIATMLLVVSLFSCAIQLGTGSYPDYLLSCILLVVIAGKELCLTLVWWVVSLAAGLSFCSRNLEE